MSPGFTALREQQEGHKNNLMERRSPAGPAPGGRAGSAAFPSPGTARRGGSKRAGRPGPGLPEGGAGSTLDAAEAVGHPEAAGRPERRPSRRASRGADPPHTPERSRALRSPPSVKSRGPHTRAAWWRAGRVTARRPGGRRTPSSRAHRPTRGRRDRAALACVRPPGRGRDRRGDGFEPSSPASGHPSAAAGRM